MRGSGPRDGRAFGARQLPRLREAVADLSWLLGRGYSARAATTLVGDRLQLDARQRHAIARAAVPAAQAASRAARRVPPGPVPAEVWVDGFNVLVTLERLLGGAVVMRCRDGVLRDIGGVHGTYRVTDATHEALARLIDVAGDSHLRWLFDAPVSNSGRAAGCVRDLAASRNLPWTAEVVKSPDGLLPDAPCAATGDGPVIDRCAAWLDLPARAMPIGHVVDLG